MYKKLLFGVVFLALLTTLLAACSIEDTASNAPSGPSVHMGNASFVQTTITVSKGQSINLMDDVGATHIVTNGFWKGTSPDTSKESGAPAFNQTFGGNDSAVLGPFTSSGTYHYYCTIHPGMNLTVTVQ